MPLPKASLELTLLGIVCRMVSGPEFQRHPGNVTFVAAILFLETRRSHSCQNLVSKEDQGPGTTAIFLAAKNFCSFCLSLSDRDTNRAHSMSDLKICLHVLCERPYLSAVSKMVLPSLLIIFGTFCVFLSV